MGRMTHYFAKRFMHIYALDVSEEMIHNARGYWGKLMNVSFIVGNGSDLQPIPNNKVDFVFSFYVLNHVVHPNIVLNYIRETARVLKPKGLALLHFRIPPDYPLWKKSVMQRVMLLLRGFKTKDPKVFWWNEGIKRKIREYQTSLPAGFNEFESWRGCEVPWEEVVQTSKESGLRIINTDSALAANTQFVFVLLRKK
jgi:ubiquinone/menaquinone biosynthesis C-methylase UbiE